MLDAKIIVVGVAGVFVALGVVAAAMLGLGHITTAVGQTVGIRQIAQAGNQLAGLGLDLVIVLVVLAAVIVAAFLYVLLR